MTRTTRRPTLNLGLLTTDSVNEQYASQIAARTRGLVIAAPNLELLQRSGVDAVVYDLDHLKLFGDPMELVVPGAARLQVAFGYSITGEDARKLRARGVIVCRRLRRAVRTVTRLLRPRPAAAA